MFEWKYHFLSNPDCSSIYFFSNYFSGEFIFSCSAQSCDFSMSFARKCVVFLILMPGIASKVVIFLSVVPFLLCINVLSPLSVFTTRCD